MAWRQDQQEAWELTSQAAEHLQQQLLLSFMSAACY
jgi:hypothetical protein